jgi:hypothetical protein
MNDCVHPRFDFDWNGVAVVTPDNHGKTECPNFRSIEDLRLRTQARRGLDEATLCVMTTVDVPIRPPSQPNTDITVYQYRKSV